MRNQIDNAPACAYTSTAHSGESAMKLSYLKIYSPHALPRPIYNIYFNTYQTFNTNLYFNTGNYSISLNTSLGLYSCCDPVLDSFILACFLSPLDSLIDYWIQSTTLIQDWFLASRSSLFSFQIFSEVKNKIVAGIEKQCPIMYLMLRLWIASIQSWLNVKHLPGLVRSDGKGAGSNYKLLGRKKACKYLCSWIKSDKYTLVGGSYGLESNAWREVSVGEVCELRMS